jgi:hypothetical protein
MNASAAAAVSCMPTWSLHTLQPIFWQVDRIPLLHLRHMGTQVAHAAKDCTRGRSVWADHSGGSDVAVSWDWTFSHCHGASMDDPFGLVTNLRFIDSNDEVLTAVHAAPHLTSIIHALPWEDEVWRAIEGTQLAA